MAKKRNKNKRKLKSCAVPVDSSFVCMEADSNPVIDQANESAVPKFCEQSTDETLNTLDVPVNRESNTQLKSRLVFYPFAYALHNEELDGHCWYCLLQSKKLRRCLGCGFGLFCGPKCQSLGWKDHKIECKALKREGLVPDIESRLLGRIVTRYKAILKGADKVDPNFYLDRSSQRSIMEIWGHTDLIRADISAMDKFDRIFDSLVEFYGSKHMLPKEDVFELHCRNFINRHAISDREFLREIGKGLYLDLCEYNHSCRPNSVYTCEGFVATLRNLDAQTKLSDRKSTFYTYIDLFNTTLLRRKMLKDSWYFDCECNRCVDEDEDKILSAMLCPNCAEKRSLKIFGNVEYKDPVTQIITCPYCHCKVSRESVIEAVNAMQFIRLHVTKEEIEKMEVLARFDYLADLRSRMSKILPNENIYYCRIIQMIIPYVNQTDYKLLLELHLESEACIRCCYPLNHPAVALHLRNIGLFYLRSGNPHRAMHQFHLVREIVNFTLDEDHPMSCENQALSEEALVEVDKAKQLMLR